MLFRSASACLNTPITFTNASTPTPVSSAWDFGDGTQSNLLSPTKSYAVPGTYPVTLTNTYAACSNTTTTSITIGSNFTPAFTANATSSCQAPFGTGERRGQAGDNHGHALSAPSDRSDTLRCRLLISASALPLARIARKSERCTATRLIEPSISTSTARQARPDSRMT